MGGKGFPTEPFPRCNMRIVGKEGVGGLMFPFIAGKMYEAARNAGGDGSRDDAYPMAAVLLVAAGLPTYVTRGVENRHKRTFSI